MPYNYHFHECTTPACLNFMTCWSRDCRDGWTCPSCEDDEHFADIERMDLELNRNPQPNSHKDMT